MPSLTEAQTNAMRQLLRIAPVIDDLGRLFSEAGHEIFLVGGSVRDALLDFQPNFAAHPPGGKGAVLDGRDIGTVICPDATIKLFVTAAAETRARRRFLELGSKDSNKTVEDIKQEIIKRDENDSNREYAPLKQAEDAVLIDTTNMSVNSVIETILNNIRR